jgi:uncharacterized membrane protein
MHKAQGLIANTTKKKKKKEKKKEKRSVVHFIYCLYYIIWVPKIAQESCM